MYHAMYNLLNLHVSASNDEVVAALHARLKPEAFAPDRADELAELERAMVQEHHEAGCLYADVVGGRL